MPVDGVDEHMRSQAWFLAALSAAVMPCSALLTLGHLESGSRQALARAGKERAAGIRFRIAEALEEAGRVGEAIEAYFENIYSSGEERDYLIRSYLRLARIFEDKQDWAEAGKIYGKIAAMDVDEAKFARERLDWIAANVNSE